MIASGGESGSGLGGADGQLLAVERLNDLDRQESLQLLDIRILPTQIAEDVGAAVPSMIDSRVRCLPANVIASSAARGRSERIVTQPALELAKSNDFAPSPTIHSRKIQTEGWIGGSRCGKTTGQRG